MDVNSLSDLLFLAVFSVIFWPAGWVGMTVADWVTDKIFGEKGEGA